MNIYIFAYAVQEEKIEHIQDFILLENRIQSVSRVRCSVVINEQFPLAH